MKIQVDCNCAVTVPVLSFCMDPLTILHPPALLINCLQGVVAGRSAKTHGQSSPPTSGRGTSTQNTSMSTVLGAPVHKQDGHSMVTLPTWQIQLKAKLAAHRV